MSALFGALVAGPLRAGPLRALVTLVAVALGVAIGLAIDLANRTAIASFASSVDAIANRVNLQVLGVGRGFDERALVRIARLPGVTSASPAVEDTLTLADGDVVRVLGVDLLRPLPGDASPRGGADPALLVFGRGAFVAADAAARYGWRPGARIRGLAGARDAALTVAGVIPRGTPGIDASVVLVDVVTAQELFGKVGLLDRIDLVVDPARLPAVERAIRPLLPPGARAIAPQVRTGEIARMLQSFRLNLEALAYVALLVGMYLIYNTVAISVVQRRPEIGTVRALGATRGAVFRTFLAEGAAVGAAGALLGLALGAVLASSAVAVVARTVDTLYVGTHPAGVAFAAVPFLRAFGVGVAASVLAAALPAYDAATTAPAITMRAQGFETRRPRLPSQAALAAVVLFALAYGASRLPALDGVPAFGYVAGLLAIAGGSLLAPLAVTLLARFAAACGAGRPPVALAAANLAGSPLRIAVAVASLTIAIAMMVSVAVLVASFRTTVVAWAGETLRADLFVRPLGLGDASSDPTLPASAAARIAALPGVARVTTYRGFTIPFRGRLTNLGASDLAHLDAHAHLRLLGRVDRAALSRRLAGRDAVLVSEPFATKFGVRPGDRVALPTPSGTTTFAVEGVYNDYSSDAGIVLLDVRTYRRLFRDDAVNSIAVFARSGTGLEALRARIVRTLVPARVEVQTNRELRRLVIAIFDRTFAITYALDVIAIAIAVLGVVSTLFALVLERRRELGILRYLGLAAGGVRATVLVEAAGIGLAGGVLGTGVGMALALLLVYVVNFQSFGWLIELHVPWAFLAETIALVVVAAVLAGISPAGLAARIRTADAVRTE